jgi:hypothetical protein
MAPQSSLAKSSVHTENAKLIAKLDKVAAEIEEVRKRKELLAPKKEKKTYNTKKIDHRKPKRQLIHPKLDYVYGEVAFSPYLTKPLDPYPETTFTMVEELRELKRKGVKKIEHLPEDKRPYDPKKIKDIFINDVLKYEVSFLPKGYEERKQREMELSQSMSQMELGDTMLEGGDRRERSSSPNMAEKRSQILLRNIARGGPAKYMKELKALKETRESANLDEMAEAMLTVGENEVAFKESRKLRRREESLKNLEAEEFRRARAQEGIANAKATANRIFEMRVPENIRSERVSSPPRLLALMRREMEERLKSQRGRERSPDYSKPPTALRSLSPSELKNAASTASAADASELSEHQHQHQQQRPATANDADITSSSTSSGKKAGSKKTRAVSSKKQKMAESEPPPPLFVVTPMNAADDDQEVIGEGNYFNFEDYGKLAPEPSPFDDIAPDVATYGSVEDNINVLRESIGIPDEVEDGAEDSRLSAPNSRPHSGAPGSRPGTSNKGTEQYRDRVGKSSGRASRGGNGGGNGIPAQGDDNCEDVFPDYNPDDDNDDVYVADDVEDEEPATEAERALHSVANLNIVSDIVAATKHVVHSEEAALGNVAEASVVSDIAAATQHLVEDEGSAAAATISATEAAAAAGEEGTVATVNAAVYSEAVLAVDTTTGVEYNNPQQQGEVGETDELLLTVPDSPVRELEQDDGPGTTTTTGGGGGMRFEEASQSYAAPTPAPATDEFKPLAEDVVLEVSAEAGSVGSI